MKINGFELKTFAEGGMWKSERIFWFAVFALVLSVLLYSFEGSFFPETIYGIVIYSALLMLAFSLLFLEHYFTQPRDILSNAIAIVLLLAPIRNQLNETSVLFDVFFFYTIAIAILSLVSIVLYRPDESPDSRVNIYATKIRDLVATIGKGKVLYFTLFVLALIFYVDSNSGYFLSLFIFSAVLLLIDPKQSILKLIKTKEISKEAIGQIFGVQSKNVFLVKLFENREASVRIFDFVAFKYSVDNKDRIFRGIVLDNYLLNQEQWVKVLVTKEIEEMYSEKSMVGNPTPDTIYKIERPDNNSFAERFVGVVTENSTISKIRFIYSSKLEISEGQLLEVSANGKKVLYQIIQGTTKIESLGSKNEAGYVIGEAIQLGVWSSETLDFTKFGWVPQINSIVMLTEKNEYSFTLAYPEYKLGVVPSTYLPSVLNLQDAISHHLAILGVTGAGKSYIAREIIKEVMSDTKVVCVDFTGEYNKKLSSLNPEKVEETQIDSFLGDNQKRLGIFELPDMSNTTDVLKSTQDFLDKVFKYAKDNEESKICIVIEEAHTVVPETNFLGDFGDYSSNKALVNKMGQIALQGRKYGVGLMVIAQRTANVSKTVLTQCNSVICFQAFDETSFNFLGNYIGKDLVQTLPNLLPYHAIIAGKAAKSNVPMIVDLTRVDEESGSDEPSESEGET